VRMRSTMAVFRRKLDMGLEKAAGDGRQGGRKQGDWAVTHPCLALFSPFGWLGSAHER
jgi:hypothetical protein